MFFLRGDNVNTEIKDGVLTINSPLLQAVIGIIKNKHIELSLVTIEARENGAVVLLKKADVVAEISMRGKKESLNVAVATGVALFRILGI